MKTKLISIKDRLPKFKTPVLIWVYWGHKWHYEIASLFDLNGINGYTEWRGLGGSIIKNPNKEYPLNLEWNIGGSWVSFDKCPYWISLPNPPQEQYETEECPKEHHLILNIPGYIK